MEQKRILELALESLQQQKAGIEADIETLRAELNGTGRASAKAKPVASTGARIKRQRTQAEKKAQAKRMREIWAAKRAKAKKPAAAAPSARTGARTAAQKKALSLKLKESWKKRKAAKAEMTATAPKKGKSPEKTTA